MTFYVGQRIRFSARFTDADRKPMDPREIVAIVLDGGTAKTYTMRSGVRRLQLGVFFVEHLLRVPGTLEVQFRSVGVGEEGQRTSRFAIAPESSLPMSELANELAPDVPIPFARAFEQDAIPDAADEIAAMNRAYMIDEIRARGGDIDDGKSDAYIQARFDSMKDDGAETPRDRYLRRMRNQ